MVQLIVRMPDGPDVGEWTIIEMQGDIETKSQAAALNGKFVGDLHFSKKKEPMLIIGHHILMGKVVKLERPFVAVKKCHPDLRGGADGDDSTQHVTEEPMDTENSARKQNTEYLVKAVIKRKIIFKTRPKPIIANVPKKI